MTTPICRFCSIVPPFVLEQIARTGTPEQRGWALDTLRSDSTIRTERLHRTLRVRSSLRAELAGRRRGTLSRTIFDAENREDAEADQIVRREGEPSGQDLAVNEAYDGLGATHSFYWDLFRRDSIDDRGMGLEGVVHYGIDFDNAMWDGARMLFGDGDGQILTRTTAALDVIGHELTHGVTQYTANLIYIAQSGALNESISDVFGMLIKQRHLGRTAAQSDWLVGVGIVGPVLGGGALRSMADPGSAYQGDPQVGHMRDYVRTSADNRGVHINSGIPNRAFHQVALALGGHAWERAGRIWYAALCDPELRADAQFADFAAVTTAQARRLYGSSATEVVAVTDAWRSVGVVVS
ncbi:MAG TPA: M4 family metallopeptidase [Candidatus Dormibacteraeota bacterium]|nr:M4 family metallopeptidase [Candidatus Dormibacteraeota bacterium]